MDTQADSNIPLKTFILQRHYKFEENTEDKEANCFLTTWQHLKGFRETMECRRDFRFSLPIKGSNTWVLNMHWMTRKLSDKIEIVTV